MAGMPVFQDSPSQLKSQIFVTDGTNIVPLKSNASGSLTISTTGADAIAVTATDLDIRNLSNTTDEVVVYGNDGTSNVKLSTTATGAVNIATAAPLEVTTGADPLEVTATTALPVSIADPVAVTATDLDIRNLTNANDEVVVYGNDGTSNVKLSTTATGAVNIATATPLTVTTAAPLEVTTGADPLEVTATTALPVSIADPVAVTATDLDIRNLTNANDEVVVYGNDGTSNVKLSTTATGAVNIATATPLTVTSTDLDIRNLTNANDNVVVYGSDGTNNVALKTDTNGVLYTSTAHTLMDTTEQSIAVASSTNGAPSTQRDISVLANYGFLVNNTANASVGVKIQNQISPDGTLWIDDGDKIDLAAGKAMVVTPSRFLRYARVMLFLASGETSMNVGVWFQGQY